MKEKMEKKETPAFEVKEHSTGFLKKAAKMSEKKPKAKKMGKAEYKK